MSIRHVCEASLPELNAYLNYMGPEPHDGPMPVVDVSEWAVTIAGMPKLMRFNMKLELGIDRERIRLGKERSLSGLSSERGRVLATDIAKRLRSAIRKLCDRNVTVQVKYTEEAERDYLVAWAGAIQPDWPGR